jgi:protein MpaA
VTTAVAIHAVAPFVRREVRLGRSAEGRAIVAWEVGDPSARRVTLVVGCIHGNEPAGITVATKLERMRPAAHTLLWIVPDLNPDGVAAHTRQNGRSVDLNRNFPWHWQPLGPPGSTFYAGSRAASEVETRIAMRLIRRIRPTTSVWFHQHLGLVDESGGDVRIERRFAQLTGMRTSRLPRYPGGVVNWENRLLPGTTAFVVELPRGPVSPVRAGVLAHGIEAIGRGF